MLPMHIAVDQYNYEPLNSGIHSFMYSIINNHCFEKKNKTRNLNKKSG